MTSLLRSLTLTASAFVLLACSEAGIEAPKTETSPKADSALEINYDKFTLENLSLIHI